MVKRMICLMTAVFLLTALVCPAAYAAGHAEYETLTQRWLTRLTGGNFQQSGEAYNLHVRPKVQKISSDGKKWADSLTDVPEKNRDYLWSGYVMGDTGNEYTRHARNMSHTFQGIEAMALAYRVKGTELYGSTAVRDKIISALTFMYRYKYNEKTPRTNRNLKPANPQENWYEWEIRAPEALVNTMILMKGDLDDSLMRGLMKGILKQVPSIGASATGANRLDMCLSYIVGGIALEDGARIQEGINALDAELTYHTADDGFYEDGSFIQHHNYPYNGAYGSSGLSSIADILYLLEDTSFMTTNPELAHVYRWVYDSFDPWLYEGRFMDPVRGRSLSRQSDTGYGFLEPLVVISQTAPAGDRAYYSAMVKRMAENRKGVDPYNGVSIYGILCLYNILNDSGVTAQPDRALYKNFGAMDRSVTHRPGFAFSVSMYSDRIRNFESINGENLKGWFTASGATYLYNDDLNQYLEHYWPTVDKQRIAGTTVLKNSSEVNAAFGDAFAGGVEMDGLYGVNAMQYRAPQTKDGSPGGLEAKKAWFVLDDSIVCLGADIDSSIAGAEAETIVDNRKVDDLAGRLTVNGTQMSGAQTKSFQNPAWAHLKGNTPDTVQTHSTDIGYYFPQGGALTAKQESRTDSWRSIANNGSTSSYTKSYASLAFSHGAKPADAAYAYAIVPGKTAAETAAFAENPGFSILANTNALQAVRKNDGGMIGAVIWQAGQEIAGITSHQPALLMQKEEDGVLRISISDPAHTESVLRFTLDREMPGVLSADPGVTVITEDGVTQIMVDTTGALGKTFHVSLSGQEPAGTPPVPAALEAVPLSPTGARVQWQAGTAGQYFLIFSKNRERGYQPVPAYDGNETAYLHRGLEPGQTYYYKAAAANESGVSAYSAPVAVTLPEAEAAAPVTDIYDDFEGYGAGPLIYQNHWQVKLGAAVGNRVEVTEDAAGGKRLYLEAAMKKEAAEAKAEAGKQLVPLTDTVTVEGDFQIPDTGWKNLVMLYSGNTVAVQVYSNNGSLWTYSGPIWSDKGEFRELKLSPDQSYHMRIVLDVKSNVFSVFVDGKLLEFPKGAETLTRIPTRNPVKQVDRFLCNMDSAVGKLYVDNLTVTGNALEVLDADGSIVTGPLVPGGRYRARLHYQNRQSAQQKVHGLLSFQDSGGITYTLDAGETAAPADGGVWMECELTVPQGFQGSAQKISGYFWEDLDMMRPLEPSLEVCFAEEKT